MRASEFEIGLSQENYKFLVVTKAGELAQHLQMAHPRCYSSLFLDSYYTEAFIILYPYLEFNLRETTRHLPSASGRLQALLQLLQTDIAPGHDVLSELSADRIAARDLP
jgi:hypothetical protein